MGSPIGRQCLYFEPKSSMSIINIAIDLILQLAEYKNSGRANNIMLKHHVASQCNALLLFSICEI